MNTNQIKAAGMLALVAGGVFIAFKVYSNMKAIAAGVTSAAGQAASVPKMVAQALTETVQTGAEAVKSALGMDTSSYTMPAEYNTVELPFSRWSANTIATINALNKTRGINRTWSKAGDFVGWKVYSDGTITSPDGYYFSSKTNISSAGTSDFTADGNLSVNTIQVFSPFGQDFDQTRYQWQTAQE